MNYNFLHFMSTHPCIVNINGEYAGNIDNKNIFEIDIITKTPNIYVTNTPISNQTNTLPNTFNLATSSIPYSNSDYIKVVPFPDNNYDIIMKPFYYYKIEESSILLNENVGKYFVSIIADSLTRITIFSGSNIIFNINAPKLTSAKADIKKDLLIIQGIVDSHTYYLLVLDSKLNILHNDISHSIEFSDDYVQSLKNLNTQLHHAQVNKINFSNNNIEQYLVFTNEDNKIYSKYLLPKAFLESVMIGDENTALSLLDNNLQSTNISTLQQYFGKIKNIYLNRHNDNNKINYTIYSSNYKNYNFEIYGNKIIDIEEIF